MALLSCDEHGTHTTNSSPGNLMQSLGSSCMFPSLGISMNSAWPLWRNGTPLLSQWIWKGPWWLRRAAADTFLVFGFTYKDRQFQFLFGEQVIPKCLCRIPQINAKCFEVLHNKLGSKWISEEVRKSDSSQAQWYGAESRRCGWRNEIIWRNVWQFNVDPQLGGGGAKQSNVS